MVAQFDGRVLFFHDTKLCFLSTLKTKVMKMLPRDFYVEGKITFLGEVDLMPAKSRTYSESSVGPEEEIQHSIHMRRVECQRALKSDDGIN